MRLAKLLPLVLLCACALAGAQPLSRELGRAFEARVKQLAERRGSDSYLADRVKRTYDRDFRDVTPVTQKEFIIKLRALRTTVSYSADREYGADLLALFAQYERNFPVERSIAKGVFESLAALRMFREANGIASSYPLNVEKFKLAEGEAGAAPADGAAWRVGERGELRHAVVDVSGELAIVVTAHPFCQFARNALAEIEADEQLARTLLPKMRWMVPPGAGFAPSDIVRWNQAHPSAPLWIADGPATVPEISLWATPTFYIFRNGMLVAMQSGWLGAPSLQRLRSVVE